MAYGQVTGNQVAFARFHRRFSQKEMSLHDVSTAP